MCSSDLITVSPTVTLCEGQSTTMSVSSPSDTGNYYTYNWQPDNINGSTYTVTPPATITYTVVATAADGCGSYGLVTVNVNTRPNIASVTTSVDPVCQGSSTQLSVTYGSQAGPQQDPGGYGIPSFTSISSRTRDCAFIL